MTLTTRLLCATAALGFASSAPAQQSNAGQRAPVPPPPGLNDPGVDAHAATAANTQTQSSHPPTTASSNAGLPPLPSLHDDGGRDANGNPPPTVSVHKRDGNTIEEYRQGGRLIMVRITPKHGIPYSYTVDPAGKLHGPPGAPPVKPVYYTIFEWGKPPAPAKQ